MAARQLQRALLLVESAFDTCELEPELGRNLTLPVKEAKSLVIQARRRIEELDILSFTIQSRLYRLFEWLEECMDYASESMVYEELGTARVDLSRAIRGLEEAISLLKTHAGVHASRPAFHRITRSMVRLSKSRRKVQLGDHAEIIHLPVDREEAEERNARPEVVLL